MLVRKLQSTGNFYAVTLMTDEPGQLFNSLVARREKRDDASIQYNKYFWKTEGITAYLQKNRLDAVMVVVISGLTKNSKIYSSNLLTYLETNFNFLTMTAQIVGSDGTVLWEYPNFRGRLLPYYPLVNLQYPDFSESEANLSRKTELRFKSLEGIRRTLEQKKSDWTLRETLEPEVYGRLFDEMVSLIKNPVEKKLRGDSSAEKKQLSPEPRQLNKLDQPELKSAPLSSPDPAPTSTVAPTNAPATAPNEIVPATESTR
jgi:hypothetical protein